MEKFNDVHDDWRSLVSWISNTDIRIGLLIVFAADIDEVKETTNQDVSWSMYFQMSVDYLLRR